jgi:indolepyruvate ferredoxin oxidoreductase beta subunit
MLKMTTNILLTGVGGQGTILTTKILSSALAQMGYDVKMSEIHGMSQRGGTVNTQLKFGDRVYAPNIGEGEADLIVSFEKVEALRALPYLKKGGRILMDAREIYSLPVLIGQADYPHDADKELINIAGRVTVIPASDIAEKLGNIKAQNICLLGALVKALKLTDFNWEGLISSMVPPKMAEVNLKAFRAGLDFDFVE